MPISARCWGWAFPTYHAMPTRRAGPAAPISASRRPATPSCRCIPAIEFGGESSVGGEGTLLRHFVRVGMTQFLGSNERQVTASLEGAPLGHSAFHGHHPQRKNLRRSGHWRRYPAQERHHRSPGIQWSVLEQQHHPCAWREDCHAFLIAPSARSSAPGTEAPMKTARYLASPSFTPPALSGPGCCSPAEEFLTSNGGTGRRLRTARC